MSKYFCQDVPKFFGPAKKQLFITLPYINEQSIVFGHQLKDLVHKYYHMCNLNVSFSTKNRIQDFFRFKDRLAQGMRSHIIYDIKCGCGQNYIGKTDRHYQTRHQEHITGKPLKTAITKHLISSGHPATSCEMNIIGSDPMVKRLSIKETYFIKNLKPSLNDAGSSINTFIF